MSDENQDLLPSIPTPEKEDDNSFIPKEEKAFKTYVARKDKDILKMYFSLRPKYNEHDSIMIISATLEKKPKTVEEIIRKGRLREEAKVQRKEYADLIYGEKIPLAKAIVSLSLNELYSFMQTFKPTTIEDAKGLSKIATDLNNLLRLELGQSTQNIDIVTRTEKSIETITEELKANDPFGDYSEVEGEIVDDKK